MLYKKFEIELLNDNSCSIKKFKGKESSVVVPQEVEISGKVYTVTAIGNAAFAQKDALEEIRLPETITSIGDRAFEECRNLQNINLPEGLTHIGKDAFNSTYPDLGCILYDKNTKMYGWLGNALFLDCIEVPEGVTEIDPSAFYYVTVDKVVLPSTLKKIGKSAFESCTCKQINLPDGLTEIGESAFEHCSNLKSITIPAGIKVIKKETFSSCSSLESVKFQQGLEKIEDSAFSFCSRLASVKIPKGVKVDQYAFHDTEIVYIDPKEEKKPTVTKGASLDTEDLYVVLYPNMLRYALGSPYIKEDDDDGLKKILLFHSYDDAKKYMITNDFEQFGGCYLIGHLSPSEKYANVRNAFKCNAKLGVTHYLIDGNGLGSITDYLNECGETDGECLTIHDMLYEQGDSSAKLMKEMFKSTPICGVTIMNFTYPFDITKERENELFNQIKEMKSLDDLYDVLSSNKYYENCHVLCTLGLKLMMGSLSEKMNAVLPVYEAAIWQTIVTDQARLFLLKNKMEGGYMTKELPKSDKALIYVAFTDIHSQQFPWVEFQEIEMVDLSTILEENNNIVGVSFCDMAGIEANVGKPGWLS